MHDVFVCPPAPQTVFSDQHQFIKNAKPVNGKNGIAWEDYERMNVRVRKSANERQMEPPPWALNDELLAEVVTHYMEGRAQGHGPRPRTLQARLAGAQQYLLARRPEKSETLTRLCKEYVALKRRRRPNRLRLRELEVEIENLDTQLCILDRGAALIVAVIYLYWRANQNSVYVAQELGIKPPHVRTILHRLDRAWIRMKGQE
jgi:hypothetical protein